MSPIPCFQGSCSNDLEFDPIFGLTVTARLARDGSLDCVDRPDPDTTDGLFVKVAGLVDDATSGIAPAAVPCGQSIGRDTDGNLFAYPEGAATENLLSDPVGLRHIDGDGNYDVHRGPLSNIQEWSVDVHNPFDCPAWCFYTIGEMRIQGAKIGSVVDQPFYYIGSGLVSVTAGGGSPSGNLMQGAVNRQDVHGVWAGDDDAKEHFHGWNMHALFDLDPLATKAVVNRITTDRLYHFATSAAVVGGAGEHAAGGVQMSHAAAIFVRKDSLLLRP